MPHFSEQSKSSLKTCDSRIQRVLNEVINHFDFAVLEGHRPKERQNQLYKEGKSQLRWPDSKHNSQPSRAVDIVPYPVNWEDRERATLLAGWVLATAAQFGIQLRWGGDWDQDTEVDDNEFDDLWHFELVE